MSVTDPRNCPECGSDTCIELKRDIEEWLAEDD